MSSPSKFKVIKLRENEILYREGDPSQCMYMVKTGIISVYHQDRDKNLELVRIQAGQLIGELAFFNPVPRTSNAKAIVETELLEISFQEIQKDFERFPGWAKVLLNTMSSQVIKYSRELKQYRVADNNEADIINAALLRHLTSILLASDLYGKNQKESVVVDRNSLKLVCTYVTLISALRMNEVVKALGTMEGFKLAESGEDYMLTIESIDEFKETLKSLSYYVASHPQLLHPSQENADFLKVLAKLSKTQSTDSKGLLRISSALVISELKAIDSKANFTTVDGLIQQKLPIQKQPGENGVDIVFSKEDICSLNRVWELLAGILKQNPFKN